MVNDLGGPERSEWLEFILNIMLPGLDGGPCVGDMEKKKSKSIPKVFDWLEQLGTIGSREITQGLTEQSLLRLCQLRFERQY
jgi:hypothetical protein